MKQKLIVLAVAGALIAPAAMADVEIYGKARVSVNFENDDNETAGSEDSAINITSNKSRLGFRGSEDLGNGLMANWQIEQEIMFDTGTDKDNLKARNTYAGLSGDFGEVRIGKHNTPYKDSTSKLDIFKDTRADYNAVVGNIGGSDVFNNRAPNIIAYLSPDMAGFSFAAAYITQYDGDDELPITTAETDRNGMSVSASYANGPLYVAAAFEQLAELNVGEDASAYKIGGSYKVADATKVGLIYEGIDLGTVAGSDTDRAAVYLNVSQGFGDNTLKAAYGMLDKIGDADDTGANHFALGLFRTLTKNTEVYALYAMTANEDNGTYGLYSFNTATTGGDASSVSFGINHYFSSK